MTVAPITSLPVYPLFLTLAVAAGAACCTFCLRRWRIGPGRIAAFLFLGAVAALFGAKLFSVVERGGVVWWDLSWELAHGYRYPGGILALVAVAPLLRRMLPRRLTMLRLADAVAPAIALAMAVVRIGCFLSGCCHGVRTALPWAVRLPADSPAWQAHVDGGWIPPTAAASAAVRPLQVYFGLSSLAVFVLLMACGRAGRPGRRLQDGETFFLFLAVDGVIKAGLEQLRLDYQAPLAWCAALFAVAGLIGLVALRLRPRESCADSDIENEFQLQ